MNPPNATISQFDNAKQRAELEIWLRLAKDYWLDIQPSIKGRILNDIEFSVVQHAYHILEEALKQVKIWNFSIADPKTGLPLLAPIEVDFSAEDFRMPEPLKNRFANNVKPEVLADIAASLTKITAGLTPAEAIRKSHELLLESERFVGTLPAQKQELVAEIETAFCFVTFAEIEQSNKSNSGQLPLLPPHQVKRKGMSDKELLNKSPLSIKSIKKEFLKYLTECLASMQRTTAADTCKGSHFFETQPFGQPNAPGNSSSIIDIIVQNNLNGCVKIDQKTIADWLKKDRITFSDLCAVRWNRFKKNRLGQQERAIKREAKKKSPSTKRKLKIIHPNSAGSSPLAAGKSEKQPARKKQSI